MKLGTIVKSIVIAAAVTIPFATHAAENVSIVSVTAPMGTTHVTFSNGVTCTDGGGHPVVGPVSNFSETYWLFFHSGYSWTQNGVNDSCA